MSGNPIPVPVLVIGAGQAGLAVGHHLARLDVPFQIVEAAEEPGASWRSRWDSLRLFTPARFSALPEYPFPGPPDAYPGRDEVSAYLSDYAREGKLPVNCGVTVTALDPLDGGHRVDTTDGTYQAEAVVIATGAFQQPRLPDCATGLSPQVYSLHTSAYRNPDMLPEGVTLVVGAGNSGLQIAAELAESRTVHLAVGSRQTELPRRVLGRDIFWWLHRTGLMRAPLHRTPKWLVGDGDTLIGQKLDDVVRDGAMIAHPRVVEAEGRTITFEDRSTLDIDCVIWATGYRPAYSWVHADIFDPRSGRPHHHRGVTSVPGLFFVGMENQYTSSSALIGWVQHDARHVAEMANRTIAAS